MNPLQCQTKYPLILIHGTGSRHRKFPNYWGRIPKALISGGALIYYSSQDAWGTIEENAKAIKQDILSVLKETHSEKVNIIAHSKGGLEARYMIYGLGMSDKVASLTTISTPHRGSKTIDFLVKIPDFMYKGAAFLVNGCSRILGDKNPDFSKTVRQLTTAYCSAFNEKIQDHKEVYYQSYAALMKNSFSDMILLIPHFIVRRFDGDNDGIVSVESAKWGEFKGTIKGTRNRGISHTDIIDLRRMNDSGIDIRDVYIGIVRDLKTRGF